MTGKAVTIYWREHDGKEKDDRIKVEFDTKSFEFTTLDNWARSRFGLSNESKLRYLRKGLETEFVPDKAWLNNKDDENPTIIISCIHNKTHVESKKPASSDFSPTLSYSFWLVIMLIAMIGLFPEQPLKYGVSLIKNFEFVDEFLLQNNVVAKRGCTMEAFVAMISWSLTNLYVRRLLNPETAANAFRKYSPDAFFGGIAAAVAIVFKYHLQMRLAM